MIAPQVSKPADREHSYHVSAALEGPAASETGLVSLPAPTSSRFMISFISGKAVSPAIGLATIQHSEGTCAS